MLNILRNYQNSTATFMFYQKNRTKIPFLLDKTKKSFVLLYKINVNIIYTLFHFRHSIVKHAISATESDI